MGTAEIKAAVRKRDRYRCVDCGMTDAEHRERYGRGLHVHRKTPGAPYTIRGCQTVCLPCHGPKPRCPAGTGTGPKLVRVEDDIYEAFRQLAQDGDRPMSREFRSALIEYLKKKGRWPPPPAKRV